MMALISDTALRRLHDVHTHRRAKPHAEVFPGAVVFCDISGFTKFISQNNNAEERCSATPHAPPHQPTHICLPAPHMHAHTSSHYDPPPSLPPSHHHAHSHLVPPFPAPCRPSHASIIIISTATINVILGMVVRLAYHCGGDVLKFAGDAAIVLFSGTGLMHSELSRRAVAFSLKLLDLVEHHNSTPLGMHIGVGVGDVASLHVGGFANRWEHVCAGDVLRQIMCVDLVGSGFTCVSAAVWAHVSDMVYARPARQIEGHEGAYVIQKLRKPTPLSQRLQPLTPDDLQGRE